MLIGGGKQWGDFFVSPLIVIGFGIYGWASNNKVT